jgi:hypothetical protein
MREIEAAAKGLAGRASIALSRSCGTAIGTDGPSEELGDASALPLLDALVVQANHGTAARHVE